MAEVVLSEGLVVEAPGVVKRPRPQRVPANDNVSDGRIMCTRCREKLAQVNGGNDKKCASCLAEHLVGKLRGTIKVKAAVVPGDRVLTALSGGPGSRALVSLMRACCATDWARIENRKVMFEMEIVHVNESALHASTTTDAPNEHVSRLKHSLSLTGDDCTVVDLEDVYGESTDDVAGRRQRLRDLLAAVPDSAARQDVVKHLRRAVLLSAAARLNCNKIVLGDSMTSIAAAFIAASAKGQGSSVTSELQLADAREGSSHAVVIRPLRDVSHKELALYCHFQGLPTSSAAPVAVPPGKPSINALSSEFILELLAKNTNALGSVVKLASKQLVFPFNDASLGPPPPEAGRLPQLAHPSKAAKRSKGAPALAPPSQGGGAGEGAQMCPLCRAPLAPAAVTQLLRVGGVRSKPACAAASRGCGGHAGGDPQEARDGGAGVGADIAADGDLSGCAGEEPAPAWVPWTFCRSCREHVLDVRHLPGQPAVGVGTNSVDTASDQKWRRTFDLLPRSVQDLARSFHVGLSLDAGSCGVDDVPLDGLRL